MTFHVEGEMIGPRESSFALSTTERFVAGVFSEVPRQLIGAGEFPCAAFPSAVVRLLACKINKPRYAGSNTSAAIDLRAF